MLKPFLEMREIDVKGFCETREGRDENGNKIQIPFLPWERCLNLLYENGAKRVRYKALQAPDGSYIFKGEETLDKNGRSGACYFVTVEVDIDGDVTVMPYPIMNGTAVVYNDTLNQLRVSNAIQRAFVKCVAVNTGLGISLWEKHDETADHSREPDEITRFTPLLVKAHIEKAITRKLHVSGMSEDELFHDLGITKKQYLTILQYLGNASWLIGELQK